MQIEVENTSELGRRLTVELPAERFTALIDRELDKMVQQANSKKQSPISGFRAGHISRRAVKLHFAQDILNQAISELTHESLDAALKDKGLSAAYFPDVEFLQREEGQPFKYVAAFDIFPEVQLTDLAQLEVEKEVSAVDSATFDEAIQEMLKQKTTWETAEKAAESGDRVDIDFDGFIGEEPIDGGSAKGFQLELGAGNMIPGFEDGLIGKKAGEEATLNAKFPDEYHAEHLKGKDAVFNAKVNRVEVAKTRDLDEEFAKEMGFSGDNGVELFKDSVRERMTKELDLRLRLRLKTALMDKLVEAHALTLPEKAITLEAQRIQKERLQQLRQQMQGQISMEELSRLGDQIEVGEVVKQQAEKRLALGLILNKVRSQFDIELDSAVVERKLDEIAQVYNGSDEAKEWLRNDQERFAELQELAMEEQLVDKILSLSQQVEKTVSYDAIMKGN